MTRLCGVVLAVLLAAAAGAQSIALGVTMPQGGIAFGEAFELSVARTWRTGDVHEPFDDRDLAPLLVERVRMYTHVGGASERVDFRARCFVAGVVKIGPLKLRYRDGERDAVATSGHVTLNVRSSLPEPAGAFEWPGDVRELPAGACWKWVFAAVALLACGGWWWRRPRAVAESTIGIAQRVAPTALRDLRALAVPGDGADAAAIAAFHQHVKRLVRQHCRERFAVAADVCTSEELLRVVPANEHAAACLLACDVVLFAAVLPPPDERARTLAAAIAFVEATA